MNWNLPITDASYEFCQAFLDHTFYYVYYIDAVLKMKSLYINVYFELLLYTAYCTADPRHCDVW